MTDVDSILNYTRSEEEDYYAILGCDETATVSVKVIDTSCATFVFFVCYFFFLIQHSILLRLEIAPCINV